MRWQSGPLRLAILTEMPLFTGINHYPLVTERFKYSCVKLLLLLQLVERTNYDIRESIAFNLHCFSCSVLLSIVIHRHQSLTMLCYT